MNDIKPNQTRENILQAANHVLMADGINRLTLEAVAQKAGVSKGGLLYHFPSKEALIEGMVDYYLTRFERRLADYLAAQKAPESPGSWVRAYILATFDEDSQETAVSSALLAAVAVNPQLLAPLQARYLDWQEQFVTSGGDPALATLIRLALDGLWVSEMFSLAAPNTALREQLLKRLLQLVEELEK